MKSSEHPQRPGATKWLPACRFLASITLCVATIAVAWSQDQAQKATQPPPQGQGRGAGRGRGIQPDPLHPVLPIGSPAPDFNLPGIDGKNHTLSEYSSSKILVIVFESNHCPVSQLYEGRIKEIQRDYKDKGLTVVGINPNNPKAIRINELDHTDMSDSLPEMKIRAEYRHFTWPYLYDGETQAVAARFGAVSTPHTFIFDQDRKLRYQGRIDDNMLDSAATTHEARDAIEALLAGKPVPLETTRAFGCSTKWLTKSGDVQAEWARILAEPVKLDMAGVDDLKKLRANPTGKMLVVNFWSTKCKECLDGFYDLETSFRMYRIRDDYTYVTVSTDDPQDSPAVLKYLQEQHASSPNLQFATTDKSSLQAAFGEKWKLGQPYMAIIQPDGKIIYRIAGKVNTLEMRREVVRNLPDDRGFVGMVAYWNSKQ
jgi:peroxiredoxin